jgi:hypothetical protein
LIAGAGTLVPRAIEGLGEMGMKIAGAFEKRVLERQKLDDMAAASDLDTNFRLNLQDKLFSTDVEKVNVGGKDTERVKGLLNRPLKSSEGTSVEFENYYKDLRSRYVSQARTPELAQVISSRLDNHYLTAREIVIKNESKQLRAATSKSLTSNLDQMAHDAAAITEPAPLEEAVKNALLVQDSINTLNDWDEETSEKNRKEAAGNIISKSVLSTLTATGSLEKAQALLDAGKSYMNTDEYLKLSDSLSTGADRLQKNQELLQTRKQIEGEADILTGFADGSLTWMNMADMGRAVRNGVAGDTFATAMADVLRRKGKYVPTEDKNINYPQVVSEIYKAETREELHKVITNLLQDNKNMSRDKMAILISGAMQRANSLPFTTKFAEYDNNKPAKADPKQREIDGAALAVVNFGRRNGLSFQDTGYLYGNFQRSIAAGVPASKAYEAAIKEFVVTKHPETAASGITPTIVTDGNQSQFFLQKAEPGSAPWIYDSKTKSIKPNPNFKAKKEEKK